jgi:2-polyprenyl-3-methyl-5-hydroxy-6-metoxy-1,4-benzoquinol methylase
LDLPLAGAHLLDYGCGDGHLLAELLARARLADADRPAVQLEDIVPADLASAAAAVGPWAASVGFTNVVDVERWPTMQHDVVLVIGVLDYSVDWRVMLRLLMERTRHILVLTLPLRRPIRNLPRRAWLALHGISAHAVSPADVETIGSELGVEISVTVRGRTLYACLRRPHESIYPEPK